MPDNPIILFIEGDGIGVDISPVMIRVIDKAVELPMVRKIIWTEVYAGEKAWGMAECLAMMRPSN